MNPQSPRSILKTMRLIHMAMLGSLAIFSVICIYLRKELSITIDKQTVEILYYISIFSVLVCIPLGYWLHSRKIRAIVNNTEFMFKLNFYQTSHITKMALFEASGFLSLIVLIVGANNYILLQIGIILIFMLLNTPSVHKLTTELGLSHEESNLLML